MNIANLECVTQYHIHLTNDFLLISADWPVVMMYCQHCAKLMNKLTPGNEKKMKLAWGKKRKDKRSSVCPTGCEAGLDYHFNFPLSVHLEWWSLAAGVIPV